MREKTVFVAAAWPYANNSLHLGHVASLIGADIIARYHRLRKDRVLFVSGSDCHGTPIIVEAEKYGIGPEKITARYHKEFVETLIGGLGFSYDVYTHTMTKHHEAVVQDIFLTLYEKDLIYKKEEMLPFCQKCKHFLPDRYVEGKCPRCSYEKARGDQCDECGNLLDPAMLLDPVCKICNGTPQMAPSEHFYLRLSKFQGALQKWAEQSSEWKKNAKNFTLGLLEQGLHDRAITRDIEWGIPIPLEGYEHKRIYVWFEAVCGYLSASKQWTPQDSAERSSWETFWKNDHAVHYYVHGKDNIPFHTIIWPAMLMGYGGLHLPDRIISSEYLLLDKQQFSKSRHWAVWLPDVLSRYDAEALRFYLVINGPETSDTNFSWTDFQTRINAELIGNLANFVHRVLAFVFKSYSGTVHAPDILTTQHKSFLHAAKEAIGRVAANIETGHFRDAFFDILRLTEHGNKYIEEISPWSRMKKEPEAVAHDLAVAVHVIRCVAIMIEPFLPCTARRILSILNLDEKNALTWEYPAIENVAINQPTPLFQKIELDNRDKNDG